MTSQERVTGLMQRMTRNAGGQPLARLSDTFHGYMIHRPNDCFQRFERGNLPF